MSKAERTRKFIIEKAAPVFNTKGYAGTSLSDMTEATGLTKGSIYGNFADKDEVAVACFEHNYKLVRETLQRESEKRSTFREKLLVYVDVYSNPQKYPLQRGGCPILNTITEADDTHPRLKAMAGEALLNWKERLTKLVEAGKAAGEFKPAVNPVQAALTLIALLEGTVLIARGTGNMAYARFVVESAKVYIQQL